MKRWLSGIALVLAVAVLAGGCAHQGGPAPQASVDPVQRASASPVIDRVQQRGQLVVGTAGNMPPLNMTTREGELIGLDVDLAKMIAAGMGVGLQWETMPFAELLPALKAGKVDMVISSMTITPSRNLSFAYVGPYLVTGKSILADDRFVSSVKNASDINDAQLTLTALQGSTSQHLVEIMFPKAKLIATTDYEAAVDLLLRKEADALFADFPVCQLYAYRNRGKGLVALKEPLTYEPLGIAVQPGDPLLVNLLQNLIVRLEGSGELDKMRKRWFENTDWVDKLP